MKSRLLRRQVEALLGTEGEARLSRLLDAAAATGDAEGIEGVRRLLQRADDALEAYAGLQRWQGELSGDVFSDWNLLAGRIESGRGWKRLLGYPADALSDDIAQWYKLIQPDDVRVLHQRVAEHARAGDGGFEADCRFRTAAGDWRWLRVRGAVTARDAAGEARRMLVMLRDVHAEKASAETLAAAQAALEQASHARGDFLANMSHEIRTPMNGIIGMTELALDTGLDGEQRQYVRTIKASAEALLAIVNDVLDYSRFEAGGVALESAPFGLADVVFDAVRGLAPEAHRKGLALLVDIRPDVPAQLLGDAGRLRQVLVNLLGNAVKFTGAGDVRLTVTRGAATADDVRLSFTVADTGVGIPRDKQQAIFAAFAQADASMTRRFGGTGLGLALCARLAQLMRGEITVDSEPGRGATFCFSARFGLGAAVAAPPRFDAARALVVAAHPGEAALTVDMLGRLGVRASAPADPATALAAMREAREVGAPYDFVLAESDMAAPGGVALAEAWVAHGRNEGLVMLEPAAGGVETRELLASLGVEARMVRPVALRELAEALAFVRGKGFALAEFDGVARLEDTRLPTGKALRVLLVEDNPVKQASAAQLLGLGEHLVTAVSGAEEALARFERGRFDVVLLSLRLPVMNGVDLAEAIRARELRRSWVGADDFRASYLVAMASDASHKEKAACLEAGINECIDVPLQGAALTAVLARAAGEAEAVQPDALPSGGDIDLSKALNDIGDLDLLVNMAQMLLAEWDTHLGQVREALAARDAATLERRVHTLRGLLAMFHIDTARQVARELETRVREQPLDWAACAGAVARLAEAMGRARPVLDDFVKARLMP